MVNISFPGLGIEPFQLNPVAFTVPLFGGLEVRWYGVIITLGIILAFSYALFRAKNDGVSFDDMVDITLFTVIFAVIGARAYYVLTSLDEFNSFSEVIAIWNGGIAIYGAIIAGAITIFAVCRYKKLNVLKMFDAVAPAVMIGQILGRWGNFFNGEAYGAKMIEGEPLYFIRMGLASINTYFDFNTSNMVFVHPTFLYESLWNLIGFIIINLLYKKKKFDGQIFLMYITWYGFGRMLIEGLRTDSLYIGVFRISQVVGFICFVVGSLLITLNLVKARRKTLNEEDYSPSFSHITGISQQASEPILNEEETKEESEEVKEEISKKLKELFDESND